MDNETNKYEPIQQTAADSDSVTATTQNILDKGTDALEWPGEHPLPGRFLPPFTSWRANGQDAGEIQ